ncbi:MAG: DUF222 domain-containing protein [Brevundimonas sp.]
MTTATTAAGHVTSSRSGALRASTDPFAPGGAGMTMPVFPVDASASQIAAHLERAHVPDLDPRDALEVVAGWQQVIGVAIAAQAEALAHMERKPGPMGRYVADEIAAALAITSQAAAVLVGRAVGIAAHPVLADALRAGTIDARKVDVILKESAPLFDTEARAGVIADAAAQAAGQTAPQLERHVRRQRISADPTTAKRRAEKARADRRVEMTWLNDGMACLTALLPAPEAVATFTVLDALASAAKVAGDERNVDQRRADAFSDIFLNILDTGVTPAGDRLAKRHGRRACLNVTVPWTTLAGLDDVPGELEGYGPVPASLARELAQDATWRRILTDPTDGTFVERGTATYRPGADLTGTVIARDVTCTAPGCRQPAARCEIDHLVPFDASRLADEQTVPSNLGAACKHHHQSKTDKVWNATRDPVTGSCTWTSPLGITYSRSPIPVHVAPSALVHRPPRPAPGSRDDPPPF